MPINHKMLIVDDDEINRELLKNIFEGSYTIEMAENGYQCLEKVKKAKTNYSAILLDVVMPGMNGIEALRHLKEDDELEKTPVFLITAERSGSIMKEAYELGVMDIIRKPIVSYVILRRVNSVVELWDARKRLSTKVQHQREELWEKAETISRLNYGMIEALATAIEFRDVESGDHVRRIHDITKCMLVHTELGNDLDSEQIDNIAIASIMHDVGKIAIPDSILNKPGRLTREEFEIIKTHTTQGALLLERIPQFHENKIYQYAHDIACHHHERWDGNGYPDGLRGDEISIWAQIVSLADVYDALSCKRVYKDAFSREKVVEMIRGGECGVFNPALLKAFLEVEEDINRILTGDGGGCSVPGVNSQA